MGSLCGSDIAGLTVSVQALFPLRKPHSAVSPGLPLEQGWGDTIPEMDAELWEGERETQGPWWTKAGAQNDMGNWHRGLDCACRGGTAHGQGWLGCGQEHPAPEQIHCNFFLFGPNSPSVGPTSGGQSRALLETR